MSLNRRTATRGTRPVRGRVRRRLPSGQAILILLSIASVATASDGLVELDQLCAVSTGCTAGDAPGFPITITGDGGRSFVLVSDLVVPGGSIDGIRIEAADVSIDLNDHTILRSECVGATTDCSTGAVGASGIIALGAASTVGGSSIRDGRVLGFGLGVALGRAAAVRNVSVRWNVGTGLLTRGRGSLAFENTIEESSFGVLANVNEPGSVIVGNRLSRNSVHGFSGLEEGMVLADNLASENGSGGLATSEASILLDNVAYGNASYGLTAFDTSVVHRNTVQGNDTGGLYASGGTLVRGNVLRGSTSGPGINTGLVVEPGLLENVLSNNTGGDLVGPYADLGANACGGTPGCP